MTYQTLFQLKIKHDYFGQEKHPAFLKFGARILNTTANIQIKESDDNLIVYSSSTNDFSNTPSICFSIDFLDSSFF